MAGMYALYISIIMFLLQLYNLCSAYRVRAVQDVSVLELVSIKTCHVFVMIISCNVSQSIRSTSHRQPVVSGGDTT